MDKIDFVITYVDGTDSKWLEKKKKYNNPLDGNRVNNFRSWDNLKYWFRSVERYAPWVNKIYLITDHQVPSWLNLDNKKIVTVFHEDYIDSSYLPLYNSNAIELKMHKIKGLSEQFVYFNDDIFLTDYVNPSDFFINGLPRDNYAEKLFVSDDLSSFNHIMLNTISIINKHFDKKAAYKKNGNKYFNRLYLKDSIVTHSFKKYKKFINFNNPHICLSFLKSSFNDAWKLEPDILENTCKSRFRDNYNVSIYLIRYYQLVKGLFIPRSCKFGKYFSLKDYDRVIDAFNNKKYKCICMNDDIDSNFEEIKNKINTTLENIFPSKSEFEK